MSNATARRALKPICLVLALAALWPIEAAAHPGMHGLEAGGGLWSGLLHPLGGLDHVLAMVAVGLWAVQRGGKATWLVPGAFVTIMLVAALYGGVAAPFTEAGILGSVVVLGLLVLFRIRPPVLVGMMIVGAFAVLHGQAHGAEAPAGALLTWYAAGFTLATVLLHGVGIALGRLLERGGYAVLLRAAGGSVAAMGAFLAIA